jgi:predicted membrane protein
MDRHALTRITAGLVIIGLGIGALLGSLDIINFGQVFASWWPLLIILVGILMLINDPREFLWPSLIVLAGFLLQLRALDLVNFNIWQIVWPAVLILVGISILINRTSPREQATNGDTEEATAIFSGSTIKNTSSNYKGGKATAIFGGVTVDLRKATITDTATLHVFALCGGVDVKVPEGWTVTSKVLPIMGGVENKTDGPSGKKAPTLFITGDVVMGGVDIKHS